MKIDKAREFYSAYYEGNLDQALKQTLEAKMRADADLRADYEAFRVAMSGLDFLKTEEIEVPMFLSDRIATRLEAERDKKRRPLFVWNQWLKGLAFTGLAGAALLGALAAIPSRQADHLGTGSMLDSLVSLIAPHAQSPAVEQPNFVVKGTQVTVEYKPTGKKTLVLAPLNDPQLTKKVVLDGFKSESPLKNPNPNSALFSVSVEGEPGTSIIAVPGSVASSSPTGEGRVTDFAAALADFYRAPVQIQVENTEAHVKWAFTSKDPVSAGSNALQSLRLIVGQQNNGMVVISDH